MSRKIRIPSYFQSYTNNKEVVEANGTTVGQCLEQLVKQFPEFKTMIFFKGGKLNCLLDVYVNERYSPPEELAKPVKNGDELRIAPLGI